MAVAVDEYIDTFHLVADQIGCLESLIDDSDVTDTYDVVDLLALQLGDHALRGLDGIGDADILDTFLFDGLHGLFREKTEEPNLDIALLQDLVLFENALSCILVNHVGAYYGIGSLLRYFQI